MRRAGDLAKRMIALAEKVKSQRPDLEEKPPVPIPERIKSALKLKSLLSARYQNRDFFICDLFDYALKDDGASMEATIFTLSTKRDLSIWEWRSLNGNMFVRPCNASENPIPIINFLTWVLNLRQKKSRLKRVLQKW